MLGLSIGVESALAARSVHVFSLALSELSLSGGHDVDPSILTEPNLKSTHFPARCSGQG